jgi:hypothetical protein
MEIDESYKVGNDDRVEQYHMTEFVNAKWFIRSILHYNYLNKFLAYYNLGPEVGNPQIKTLNGNGNYEQVDINKIYNDSFLSIKSLSNQIFINVEYEFKENLKVYNKKLYRKILNIDYVREYSTFYLHKEPEWQYWRRLDSWTALEMAFLLFFENPNINAFESFKNDFEEYKFFFDIEAIYKLKILIERAFEAEKIIGFQKEDGNIQIYTRKGNLGSWLKEMGFVAPEELKEAIGAGEIVSNDIPEGEAALSGKERQELGRLRLAACRTYRPSDDEDVASVL